MSKIQRLNCGAEFRDFVRRNTWGNPEYAGLRKFETMVVEELAEAQTFLLPDEGAYALTKSISAEFSPNFRLPYPITVFEYREKRRADGGYRKRLLIAREDEHEDGSLRISVRSIYGTDVVGKGFVWILNPRSSFWDGDTVEVDADSHAAALQDASVAEGINPDIKVFVPAVGTKVLHFKQHKMFDLPTFLGDQDVESAYYQQQAMAAIHHVAYACLIMSCRNVKVFDVPLTAGDRYMNDKRRRKGLTPFVEYKVLQLGDKNIYANSNGGTHESPKWHMVMGFVRRLTDDKYYTADTPMEERTRTTFVAAHARGNVDKGKIVKDYQLTVPPR